MELRSSEAFAKVSVSRVPAPFQNTLRTVGPQGVRLDDRAPLVEIR